MPSPFKTLIELIEDLFRAHVDNGKLQQILDGQSALILRVTQWQADTKLNLDAIAADLRLIKTSLQIPPDASPLSADDQAALAEVSKETTDILHQTAALEAQAESEP